MTNNLITSGGVIHVRIDGNSRDIPMDDLDIGLNSTDAEIKTTVANHLSLPASKFTYFAVERNEATQSLTLRPNAVFGLA